MFPGKHRDFFGFNLAGQKTLKDKDIMQIWSMRLTSKGSSATVREKLHEKQIQEKKLNLR